MRRTSLAIAIALVGMSFLLVATVVAGKGVAIVAPAALVLPVLLVWGASLLEWRSLVALLLLVVLFVPISFYRLPASLPFNLELYRVVVVFVVLCWLVALLIDPAVRFQTTVIDKPLLLITACLLVSDVVNPGRMEQWGTHAIKSVTFFISFVLVYYVIATTIRTRDSVGFLLRLLTGGATLVAVCAIIERRTGFNVFLHLRTVLPFLRYVGQSSADLALVRGGNLRVFGSAQHPIALGAMLAMVVPLSIYLMRSRGKRWLFATIVLLLGVFTTGSRTAIVMVVTEAVVYLALKPRETRRLWPLLIPMVVVLHVAVPGAIGGFREAFFPKGGIVAEQSTGGGPNANSQLAGGRIRLLKPMLTEASHHPLFGEGYGTRISGFDEPKRNAPILDNQWLNTALDIGFVGVGLWIWLFVRTSRRLVRAARTPQAKNDGDDWLFIGVAASVIAFAVGMLTFDAFGFTQVFFVFWILLGFSAALVRISSSPNELYAGSDHR